MVLVLVWLFLIPSGDLFTSNGPGAIYELMAKKVPKEQHEN